MANFARTQLLKYGWKEGKGLGKNEDGLTEAVKPTLKFDKAGIGYEETNSDLWWETLYNNTAKNIKVELRGDEVSMSTIDNLNMIDSYETVPSKNSEHTGQQKYGSFLKTSTLYNGHLIKDTNVEKEEKTAKDSVYIPIDEQPLKACDDKTAHKISKHDFTLSENLVPSKKSEHARQEKYGRFVETFTHYNDCSIGDTYMEKEEKTAKDSVHIPTDEQLLKACDDKTAHKIYRHNFTLSGNFEKIPQYKCTNFTWADIFIENISRVNPRLLKVDTMIHRKLNAELDTEESDSNNVNPEDAQKSIDVVHENYFRSKSAKKKDKKKLNKLTRQLSICSLEKNIDSKYNSERDEELTTFKKEEEYMLQLDIKSRKCGKKKKKTRRMKKSNQEIQHITASRLDDIEKYYKIDKMEYDKMKTYFSRLRKPNLQPKTYLRSNQENSNLLKAISNIVNLNDTTDKSKDIDQMILPIDKETRNINTKQEIQEEKTSWKLNFRKPNKLSSVKKVAKKVNKQEQVKKQIKKVSNPVNFCEDDLNSVIKKLTTFELTEMVNTNGLKKKLTQTHHTPV